LTFGLGIIILQGVSRRKSLAGVNIMMHKFPVWDFTDFIMFIEFQEVNQTSITTSIRPLFYFLVYQGSP
jgi:hypothetical protein